MLSITIAVVWFARSFLSKASQVGSGAVLSNSSDPGEQANTNITIVEPYATTGLRAVESEPALESETEEANHLIHNSPPDTPAELTLELREQFQAQLLLAAEMNGKGTDKEACLEWSRLLALALESEASDDERNVAFLNITYACARKHAAPSPHELRLAHEGVARRADGDPEAQKELGEFLAEHPEFTNTRSALLVVNQHTVGTVVTVDGERACTEPCTLAIPIDEKLHHISFVGPGGGEASLSWSPTTPDAPPPAIPELMAER